MYILLVTRTDRASLCEVSRKEMQSTKASEMSRANESPEAFVFMGIKRYVYIIQFAFTLVASLSDALTETRRKNDTLRAKTPNAA